MKTPNGKSEPNRHMLSLAIGEKHLALIGKVAVESSALEMFVDEAIIMLSGTQNARILIGSQMLGSKLDLLKAIGHATICNKEHLEFLDKAVAKSKHANSERIMAIHGVWLHERDFTANTTNWAKLEAIQLRYPDRKLDINQLERIAKDLGESTYMMITILAHQIRTNKKSEEKSGG